MSQDDIRTKEFLFHYADKMMSMDERATVRYLKAKGCKVPFDIECWDAYVIALTGREPCPVCGSLTIAGRWRWAFAGGGTCWFHPVHNTAYFYASIFMGYSGVDFDKALAVTLGPPCEHANYLIECEICMQAAKQRNIGRSR